MQRRDISKAIVGLAATTGAGAIVQKAQAQTCTPPCFPQTAAEAAVGVTPANTQYSPSHVGDDVRRYGNIDLTGGTDCSAILSTANSVGVSLYFPPGIYRISSNLTLAVPLIFDSGAILRPDAGVTLTINAPLWAGPWQIFNLSSGAALAGFLQPINYDGAILTEWFGAGQGGSDDSVYFNQALLAASNSGCIVVRLLAKNYNIAHTVYMAGTSSAVPNDLPVLWGTSGPANNPTLGTRITITASGTHTDFVANGSNSCNIVKAGFKDIHFVGNGSDTVIQLSGTCYYDIERCVFDGPAIGVLFYDTSTSVYTEYCRLVKCVLSGCTVTAIRYTVNGGYSSFNGSGMQDCGVGLTAAGQNVVIIDSGSVYNAPMSFQCWTGPGSATLIINNSGALTSMHGVITVEGGTPTVPITLGGGTTPVLFAGKYVMATAGCYGGTLTQVDVAQMNDTVFSFFGARRTSGFPLSTGTTTEPGNFMQGPMRLATVDIVNTAQTYYYTAVLIVQSDNTGFSGNVSVLQSYLRNNSAGYGAPTYSYGGGGIQITNPNFPSSGVYARIEMLQIGPGVPYNPNYTSNYGFAFV